MSKTSEMMAELAKKTEEQKQKLLDKEVKLGDNSITNDSAESSGQSKKESKEVTEQKKDEPKKSNEVVKPLEIPRKDEAENSKESITHVNQRISEIAFDGLLGGFIEFLNEPEKISSRVNNSVYLDDDAFDKLEKMESVMGNYVENRGRNTLNKKILLGKIVKFFYDKNVDELRKMQSKSIKDLKI